MKRLVVKIGLLALPMVALFAVAAMAADEQAQPLNERSQQTELNGDLNRDLNNTPLRTVEAPPASGSVPQGTNAMDTPPPASGGRTTSALPERRSRQAARGQSTVAADKWWWWNWSHGGNDNDDDEDEEPDQTPSNP